MPSSGFSSAMAEPLPCLRRHGILFLALPFRGLGGNVLTPRARPLNDRVVRGNFNGSQT